MMIKLLFFDYSDLETVEGFVRVFQPPTKHPANPIMVSNRTLESDRLSLYGSVIRRPDDGLWQMWYTTQNPDLGGILIAYAESEDGLHWTRPDLELIRHGDEKRISCSPATSAASR